MKLENRKILYKVFIYTTIITAIFVDKFITATLLLIYFTIILIDKQYRKGTFLQSRALLITAMILEALFIVWTMNDHYWF